MDIESGLQSERLFTAQPIHPYQPSRAFTIGRRSNVCQRAVSRYVELSTDLMSHAIHDDGWLANDFQTLEIEPHGQQSSSAGVYEVATR